MTQLLMLAPLAGEQATGETAFGGRPSAPRGQLLWPSCRSCGGAMQFLGQLRVEAEAGREPALLLMFMCRNQPGMCRQGDADGGGNAVLVVGTQDLRLVDPPPTGKTLRATRYGATLMPVEQLPNFEEAMTGWLEATGPDMKQVLGQFGGPPTWVEYEEKPLCPACGREMPFTAMLTQGPERKTEMNFGGGFGYVFRCTCEARKAKMLVQC